MAFAVTHVILTIVLLDLFRRYVFGRQKFPRYLLIVGGIAGLVPDIDIPFGWVYNFFTEASASFHGMSTHSLVFPIIFLGVGLVLHYHNKMKWAKIFYVIAAGWFFHLILDCVYNGLYIYFWPFPTPAFCPQWDVNDYSASIDAIILIAWLIHEEVHNRIRDYI